ncbi:MAG: LysR family transcriptional regulator [Pseudomonadota bacterium]
MDWDKLRIFHAVAKAGSFTGAGEVLNSSQSAISRQISALEDSLGVPLFHRHARGLILTEQGEILFETTKDMSVKLNKIEGLITDTRELAKGPLVITVPHFIGSTWVCPKLNDFHESYPDIKTTIIFEDQILNLAMRAADCAIRLLPPTQQDLVQRHLMSMNFFMCASKQYLKKYGHPKSTKDLIKHRLIGYPEGVPAPFENPNWLLDQAKIDLSYSNVLTINSVYGISQAVENSAGIALLPEYMIHKNRKLEVVLPHEEHPVIDMYFVYPEERRNSKRIGAFRDFLVQNIHKTILSKSNT